MIGAFYEADLSDDFQGSSSISINNEVNADIALGGPLPERAALVSRSAGRRTAPPPEAGLVAAAEQQARRRITALNRFAKLAAARSATIERNQWYLPVDYIALTARYGEYGLWASYHTGLDFNGDDGDPIYAVANGIITSAGYDGSYGNKTVLTLEDGTEIWYCHQRSFLVGTGEKVRGGQQIGSIGSTGNVTGSHLHLEVRPSGGTPVDPYGSFVENRLF